MQRKQVLNLLFGCEILLVFFAVLSELFARHFKLFVDGLQARVANLEVVVGTSCIFDPLLVRFVCWQLVDEDFLEDALARLADTFEAQRLVFLMEDLEGRNVVLLGGLGAWPQETKGHCFEVILLQFENLVLDKADQVKRYAEAIRDVYC